MNLPVTGCKRRPEPGKTGDHHVRHLHRRETRPRTVPRQATPRRLAAALAAVTGALLASTASVPAAFAATIPGPPPGGADRGHRRPRPAVQVINTGGMAGWQMTLIALGAALAAAVVAVLLDRALAARRATSATTA